jgi:hypothetical protein
VVNHRQRRFHELAQCLIEGTNLRRLFAKIGVNECNGDFITN